MELIEFHALFPACIRFGQGFVSPGIFLFLSFSPFILLVAPICDLVYLSIYLSLTDQGCCLNSLHKEALLLGLG